MAHAVMQKLAKERADLVELVSDLSEETLDRQVDGGWTIRQTLTHLLNAEEDHCKVIALVARGDSHRLPKRFSRDEHNNRRVTERGELSLEALLALLAEQREKTHALFERLTPEQMEIVAQHPALGQISIGKIFRVIGLHDRAHLREIAATLEQDGKSSR